MPDFLFWSSGTMRNDKHGELTAMEYKLSMNVQVEVCVQAPHERSPPLDSSIADSEYPAQ